QRGRLESRVTSAPRVVLPYGRDDLMRLNKKLPRCPAFAVPPTRRVNARTPVRPSMATCKTRASRVSCRRHATASRPDRRTCCALPSTAGGGGRRAQGGKRRGFSPNEVAPLAISLRDKVAITASATAGRALPVPADARIRLRPRKGTTARKPSRAARRKLHLKARVTVACTT